MSSARRFRIASTLVGYPSPAASERLARAAAQPAQEAPDERLLEALGALLSRPQRERESDYVDLFDRDVAANPLHETGYERQRALGVAERLADVAAFYRAFGLAASSRERVDHIAPELEFYGWLLMKEHYLVATGDAQGIEIVADARRKFLAEHLGPLAAAVGRRPAIVASPTYGPAFAWVAGLVAAECAALGIAPEALRASPPSYEPDEVRCAPAATAACRLPVLRESP